jgi:hypothetical protein
MSEMVERVARAIAYSETADPEIWSAFVEVARAAIEAMREPTEQMADIGDTATGYPIYAVSGYTVWRSMIDEALK